MREELIFDSIPDVFSDFYINLLTSIQKQNKKLTAIKVPCSDI